MQGTPRFCIMAYLKRLSYMTQYLWDINFCTRLDHKNHGVDVTSRVVASAILLFFLRILWVTESSDGSSNCLTCFCAILLSNVYRTASASIRRRFSPKLLQNFCETKYDCWKQKSIVASFVWCKWAKKDALAPAPSLCATTLSARAQWVSMIYAARPLHSYLLAR